MGSIAESDRCSIARTRNRTVAILFNQKTACRTMFGRATSRGFHSIKAILFGLKFSLHIISCCVSAGVIYSRLMAQGTQLDVEYTSYDTEDDILGPADVLDSSSEEEDEARGDYTYLAQQKKTANQALIHQLICYSESRAKSMTDLTAKSIENLLNNHVEITQCIYQLIFLRINCSIHCKIHKNHFVILHTILV